ncbi:MAG TPA: PEP-CTERM sorting domain-containing protein [Lacipirellulaceae bacterium]|nr:PEP-CTERM sorting domain-containing protein [Lacipirellulaceae bacterium]
MTSIHSPASSPFRLLGLLACAAFFAGLASAGTSHGQVQSIVDSQGFELPKFDPAFNNPAVQYVGQLEGQAPFPEPLPVGTWVRSRNVGASTAKVVNTMAAGGTQSVQVDRAPNSDVRWAVPVDGWPSARYVCIDWDMKVQPAPTPLGSFGPYFAVEAYDDDGPLSLLASLGVDAANGEVLYQQTGTGALVAPGPVVALGAWNHFSILLDYVDHSFSLWLNNSFLVSQTFVDHIPAINELNEFTDAPIAAVGAGADPDSQAAIGTAFYDNYRVIQSATNPKVPEPASCALALLGAATLASARRRRHAA